MLSGSVVSGWSVSAMLAAVLVGSIWWYGGRIEAAETETAVWKRSSERNAEALADLEKSRERLLSALSVREKELTELRSRHEDIRGRLEDITAHDDEARTWSDAPVPDAVLGVLRSYGNGIGDRDGVSASARTSAGPDRAACTGR
jgi:hypothetical protein